MMTTVDVAVTITFRVRDFEHRLDDECERIAHDLYARARAERLDSQTVTVLNAHWRYA